MYRIYGSFIEILAASIFIIPLFILYEKYVFHNVKRTFIYIVFGFYLVAVLALVGFPDITSFEMNGKINIVPFVNIVSDFANACLNVLLFVPFGFFLPMLWDKYRNMKSTMLATLYVTVLIEFSQLFTFRTADINDIITNIIGALVGYFGAKWITKNFIQHTKSNINNKDLYIIFGTVILTMFLLQPFVSSLLWEMVW